MVMYRLLFTRRQRCSEWKHLLSAIWLRNAAFYSAMSSCLWTTKKNLVTLGGLKMELVPCWNTHICVTCPSSHGNNTMWSSEALAHTTHQRCRGARPSESSHMVLLSSCLRPCSGALQEVAFLPALLQKLTKSHLPPKESLSVHPHHSRWALSKTHKPQCGEMLLEMLSKANKTCTHLQR